MRKPLFEYTREFTSKDIYEKLSKGERETMDKFKDYMLISASEERSKEAIRELLRFREVIGIEFNKIELEDLEYFLKELKQSSFADYSKNKIKGHIQRFLRRHFKDWSLRFDNFDVIKYNSKAQRKKPITSESLITEKEFDKLIKSEKSLFWKTFLMVQYEGALRTGETRTLKWSKISFSDDGFCVLKIASKKNKDATETERDLPLKNSTPYLLDLKQQQKTLHISSEWVFPSPHDHKKNISKSVNNWFKKLTKRVLGREIVNYNLRHKKASEFKEKIQKGEMTEDSAIKFMGHSQKMFNKTYADMDKGDRIKILQEQIYSYKAPTKKEQNTIKELKEEMKELTERFNLLSAEISGGKPQELIPIVKFLGLPLSEQEKINNEAKDVKDFERRINEL